jgi:hypothetical protein
VLTIRNGDVSTDLGVFAEGETAMYTCSSGYELVMSSNLSRVCQSNGQWNGTDPTCKSKDILCTNVYKQPTLALCLVKGRGWTGCIHNIATTLTVVRLYFQLSKQQYYNYCLELTMEF